MIFHHVFSNYRSAPRFTGALQFICTLLSLFILFTGALASATTYYVDSARPDDSGAGTSWATAKKTVQAGIDNSAPGDTILVKHGTYAISAACSLKTDRMMTSDDGTHGTWNTATPDSSQCILSAGATCRVFTIKGSAVTGATRIRGFKLTDGVADSEATDPNDAYGGSILIAEGADAVIENCWITANTAGNILNGYGGGVACTNAGTEPTVQYCRIDYNTGTTAWFGNGGGIYCGDSTSVQILHNIITDNIASTIRVAYGGGISCNNATAQIASNIVSNNTATTSSGAGGFGGGISVISGMVEIWDNTVTDNRSATGIYQLGRGGGIYCSGSNSIIRDNPDISYNTASVSGIGYGGGIYIQGVTVSGNTISHNTATTSNASSDYYRKGSGGGIYAPGAANVITDNEISENLASTNGDGRGGGLYFDTGPSIQRNIFSLNTASTSTIGYGGATYSYNASMSEIINNTFYRNANKTGGAGSGAGSGIYHASGGVPDVVNNIFMNHDVVGSDSLAIHFGSTVTITNNCFYNNPGGNYNANVTSLNEIAADPRFTDAGAGDFSLLYDSPCIEEGDASYPLPENGGWIVDIGAVEYTGTRHKRVIPSAGEYLFGGRVRAKVNVTARGTLSDIDMIVHPGEFHPMAMTGVERWYDIAATGGGATFDLTLSYTDDELFLVDEDNLWIWRWSGSYWDGPKAPSATSLSDNWITVAGETEFSDWLITDQWGPVGVDDGQEVPVRTELSVNYPNPFNPTTTIAYSLERPANVTLSIYDATGCTVLVLINAKQEAAHYKTTWDGRDHAGTPVASGVYFLRLRAGDFTQVRKMVLVR